MLMMESWKTGNSILVVSYFACACVCVCGGGGGSVDGCVCVLVHAGIVIVWSVCKLLCCFQIFKTVVAHLKSIGGDFGFDKFKSVKIRDWQSSVSILFTFVSHMALNFIILR